MDPKPEDGSNNAGNGASYIDNTERTETTPLQGMHHEQRGLRVIISCLSVLTVIVSVALAAQMYYGDNELERHGSIVTDSNYCSVIGANILRKGGNAVDAAVAGTICMGVLNPHLTGIGGGGLMLAYDQRTGSPLQYIDFRPSKSEHPLIGVPGFLKGLKKGLLLYGKMTWRDVLQPSINLARTGFRVSDSLAESVSFLSSDSNETQQLKHWIESLKPGSMMTFNNLADSLEEAANGLDEFYNGSFIKNLNGLLVEKDVREYSAAVKSCLDLNYQGFNFYMPGSGSGGPLFAEGLTQLNFSQPIKSIIYSILLSIHGLEELEKLFYSGVHVAAIDDNDLYVSIVSGLGQVHGAKILTVGGYILNNALEMSKVGSDGKAESLSLPLIFVENEKICGKRFVSGGSDTRDVLQLLSYLLFLKEDLQTSVEAPRARISSKIYFEKSHAPSFPPQELDFLKSVGYSFNVASLPYPSLNIIYKESDDITAYADSRGQGEAITI